VVINDLNILGTICTFRPFEADSPLIIYPDAALSFAFASRDCLESLDPQSFGKAACPLAAVATDHYMAMVKYQYALR
jgi:hypothetical protein